MQMNSCFKQTIGKTNKPKIGQISPLGTFDRGRLSNLIIFDGLSLNYYILMIFLFCKSDAIAHIQRDTDLINKISKS